MMAEDNSPLFSRPAPSSGGTVSGWLVAILLILFAALYLQMSGLWPRPLLDPSAAMRPVTPRGDLAEDEKSTIELFKSVHQSVVHITTSTSVVQAYRMNPVDVPLGSGSGIVWDQNGYIVTNYHVIRDARMRSGGKIRVVLSNGATYLAEVVGGNPGSDLAVLKIKAPASDLKPIPIGQSDDLQVGQKVFAIGSPFSLDQSLTNGIISGLGREIGSPGGPTIKDVIQVNAAINPGNSGGPLLDSAGRLIGVTTAIASETGSFSGLGFAIPVDTVNSVVTQLIRTGSAEPPTLGLSFIKDELTAELRKRGYVKEPGALVYSVWQDGPAAEAGILPTQETLEGYIWGDLIVEIDGKPVPDVKSLVQIINTKKVGDVVTLTIIRNGSSVKVPVTLRPRPTE